MQTLDPHLLPYTSRITEYGKSIWFINIGISAELPLSAYQITNI